MSQGISIVIPTHNRARLLELTLGSLGGLQIPDGMRAEILVIDNNCTDNTSAVVERSAAGSPIPVRRILESNQGLSHARNRGIAEASYDHVCYFDDDVRVAPDWLFGCAEALDTLQADCVVGPVFPVLEQDIPSYVSQRVLASLCSSYSRKGSEMIVLPPETAHEVPGCNFAVSRKVAVELGGFNPEFGRLSGMRQSGDDFEFGQRLAATGKRVVYQPRCSIEHMITAAKLDKAWFRMRWYADGLANRQSNRNPAFMESAWGRTRAAAGILRLALLSIVCACAGRRAQSFEYELNARKALGYFRGRQPRAEQSPERESHA